MFNRKYGPILNFVANGNFWLWLYCWIVWKPITSCCKLWVFDCLVIKTFAGTHWLQKYRIQDLCAGFPYRAYLQDLPWFWKSVSEKIRRSLDQYTVVEKALIIVVQRGVRFCVKNIGDMFKILIHIWVKLHVLPTTKCFCWYVCLLNFFLRFWWNVHQTSVKISWKKMYLFFVWKQ